VYDLDLLNTSTIFQFTRQFLRRCIAQYHSRRARVLAPDLPAPARPVA
jgi:hypothetical protein